MNLKRFIIFSFLLSLTSCSSAFYWPTRYLYSLPSQVNLEHQEIKFATVDGFDLWGWMITNPKNKNKNKNKKKKKKGLILYFHGNAQNMSAHYLGLSWAVKKGYDLFIIDYRGYGKNQGIPYQKGLYRDAIAAMKYATDIFKSNSYQKLILYGQSLGGAVAARALTDFPESNLFSLLVLDSTFSSYQDAAFQALKRSGVFSYISWLSYILVSDEFASTKSIPLIKTPTLVIHSKEDPVVDYKNGFDIYNNLTIKEKWLWSIPSRGHISTYHGKNKKHYRQKLLNFMDKL